MDYKIIWAAFNIRLKSQLPHLIHPDQRGFVPGRQITDNIMDAITLIEFIEQHDIPAIMLQLDVAKAFDSVEWCVIRQALEFFQFPELMIQHFNLLHNGFTSRLIGQESWSQAFPIERGVLQGAPASPSLFVLTAELLAGTLRHNDKILGIILNNCVKLLSQFADDADMFLMADNQSLQTVLDILKKYGRDTGLLNEHKTKVIRLGPLKRKTRFSLPAGKKLHWVDSGFLDVLGIVLTTNGIPANFQNYHKRLDVIFGLLHYWKSRYVSLIGKVLLLKSHIFSRFIYQMQVLPSPMAEMLDQVMGIAYKYLWDGKPDRIKRRVMEAPCISGGLGLTNLPLMNQALKIAWLPRLIESESGWAQIISSKFTFPVLHICRGNLRFEEMRPFIRSPLPLFWDQAFRFWCLWNFVLKGKVDHESMFSQPLFLNSNLSSIHYNVQHMSIVTQIGELFNETGDIDYPYFVKKYGDLISEVQYLSHCGSVPNSWRFSFQIDPRCRAYRRPFKIRNLLRLPDKIASEVYQDLLKDRKVPLTCLNRWEEDLLDLNTDSDESLTYGSSVLRALT